MENIAGFLKQVEKEIESAIPNSEAKVVGGMGHFAIEVKSPEFKGKSTLEKHRMVLTAIDHHLKGPEAPIHAVDSIKCLTE